MDEHEKNIRALRDYYCKLVKTGLGPCRSAMSTYDNFPHSKTTGWYKNEYSQPVIAFSGPFAFDFVSNKIYKEFD